MPSLEKGERNRNNLFIASINTLDYNKITIPITYMDKNLEKVYDIRKNLLNQKTIDLSNARIISDDFPLME
ncbi:MAG: hypothetical protein ACKO7P_03060, partial [Bacteroidota bacterium]